MFTYRDIDIKIFAFRKSHKNFLTIKKGGFGYESCYFSWRIGNKDF